MKFIKLHIQQLIPSEKKVYLCDYIFKNQFKNTK
jgi:hypothetical protein